MRKRPKLNDILKAAGYVYGASPEYITQDTNKQEVVRIRQVVHYIARNLTRLTLGDIGKWAGGRDHATVIHSIKCVTNDYDLYDDTRYLVDSIMSWLKEEGFCIKTNNELLREHIERENKEHNKRWPQTNTEKQGMTSSATL